VHETTAHNLTKNFHWSSFKLSNFNAILSPFLIVIAAEMD